MRFDSAAKIENYARLIARPITSTVAMLMQKLGEVTEFAGAGVRKDDEESLFAGCDSVAGVRIGYENSRIFAGQLAGKLPKPALGDGR